MNIHGIDLQVWRSNKKKEKKTVEKRRCFSVSISHISHTLIIYFGKNKSIFLAFEHDMTKKAKAKTSTNKQAQQKKTK